MGREAGIDQRELLGLRIVHRELAAGGSSGNTLADGWSEPFLQKSGLAGGRMRAANQTRPFSSIIGLWWLVWRVPDLLVAPIGRRRQRLIGGVSLR